MTTFRLAWGGGGAINHGRTFKDVAPPAFLTSYVYLKHWTKHRSQVPVRSWVMDSGAFTAHAQGIEISLDDYIETCQRMRASDPLLVEVFALDVIGDHRASLKNCEAMWKAGVEAVPCFHVGEPEDVLITMARDYPKIALGGAVGFKGKLAWAQQCFARVWPKKIHGFGYGSERDIMALPWHSVDASNWEIGPLKFGRYATVGSLPLRGGDRNLKTEVEHYLAIERRAQHRWRSELAQLEQGHQ